MTESHNTRSLNLGKLEALPLSASDVARFWAKVRRTGDDACWEWTASRTGSLGYGQFCYQAAPGQQRHAYAHRVAWTLSHGPIPVGAQICHHCDNPRCVNVDHLFLGTQDLNNKDAAKKGRFHTPRPGKQKLTDAECDAIVALVQAGEKGVRLAERYGVSKTQVSLIVRGKRRQYRRSA